MKHSARSGVGPDESGRIPSADAEAAPSLPVSVRALGWTSFLTDFSSEAIYPLLPGFVKGLGGTGGEIGLIDGIANAVAAIVRPLMAFAASPLQVLLIRAADRFGKGVRAAARDALVATLAADGRRGAAFGWYALVQGLMALPAGLIAGWLWDSGPSGAALSFAVTATLSLAACGLLVLGWIVLGRAARPGSPR